MANNAKAAPIWAQKEGLYSVAVWERITANGTFRDVSVTQSWKKENEEKWNKRSITVTQKRIDDVIKMLQEAKKQLEVKHE